MRAVTSRRAVGVAARSTSLVLFAVVVAAVVALVLSLLSTSRYRATADVLVGAGADGVELLVAANVAATVAQSGRRVVLIDGDLRSPQVHRLFGIGNDVGLSSVVLGEASLRHCVQRLDVDRNVALLSAGPPPSHPTELLSHDRMRRAVESLAGASNLLVIDAPPVLSVTDSVVLAQLADAALLVATEGLTYQREWAEALERLRTADTDVIGTVLLRPDARVTAPAGPASTGTDADEGQIDEVAGDGPPEDMAVDTPAPEVTSAPAGDHRSG
jgi:capsular exopolysaccharide synthesis family protein